MSFHYRITLFRSTLITSKCGQSKLYWNGFGVFILMPAIRNVHNGYLHVQQAVLVT